MSTFHHTIAVIAIVGAPPFIQRCINTREDAAGTLAAHNSRKMSEAHDALYDETCNARKTGIISNDLSGAMMPLSPETEKLQDFPGSTVLAYILARELANCYYGELKMSDSGYGDRPSNLEVDFLSEKLATK